MDIVTGTTYGDKEFPSQRPHFPTDFRDFWVKKSPGNRHGLRPGTPKKTHFGGLSMRIFSRFRHADDGFLQKNGPGGPKNRVWGSFWTLFGGSKFRDYCRKKMDRFLGPISECNSGSSEMRSKLTCQRVIGNPQTGLISAR